MKKYIIFLMIILVGCNGNTATTPNRQVLSYNCSYDWGRGGWGNGTPAWCEGATLQGNVDEEVTVYDNSRKNYKILRIVNEIRVSQFPDLRSWLELYDINGNLTNTYNSVGRTSQGAYNPPNEYYWFYTSRVLRINITNR